MVSDGGEAMMKLHISMTAWLLALPTTLPAKADQNSTPAALQAPVADEDCTLPPGWDAVEKRDPRFILFGELHGTDQSPAFFGRVACALAMRGQRLLIGVEHDSMQNAAFQAAWALPPAQFGEALYKAGWLGRSDGVASRAMFAMLVRLHRLKSAGYPISITAFNGAKDQQQEMKFAHLSGQNPHEAAQAENIRDAADGGMFDRVLILAGGAHAKKTPMQRAGFQFEPMAMKLAPADQILSLDMRYAGGSSWNCIMKSDATIGADGMPQWGDVQCGSVASSGLTDLDRPDFIALAPFPGDKPDKGFDGFYWLGRIHASPPAIK